MSGFPEAGNIPEDLFELTGYIDATLLWGTLRLGRSGQDPRFSPPPQSARRRRVRLWQKERGYPPRPLLLRGTTDHHYPGEESMVTLPFAPSSPSTDILVFKNCSTTQMLVKRCLVILDTVKIDLPSASAR